MPPRMSAGSAEMGDRRERSLSRLYRQGIVSGALGAGTLALWFLILDLFRGTPFHTPTVLGMALLDGRSFTSGDGVRPSFELVLGMTWITLLVFIILGAAASRLLGVAEGNPNLGFGILLFFVIFMYGFLVMAMSFAEPVLHALTWPAILVGNLLAVAAMAAYLWWCHPTLRVLP